MKTKKTTLKEREAEAMYLRNSNMALNIQVNELRGKLQARLDTNMLQQRIELARALGQMIEATSKAIMFIVAGEAI